MVFSLLAALPMFLVVAVSIMDGTSQKLVDVIRLLVVFPGLVFLSALGLSFLLLLLHGTVMLMVWEALVDYVQDTKGWHPAVVGVIATTSAAAWPVFDVTVTRILDKTAYIYLAGVACSVPVGAWVASRMATRNARRSWRAAERA